MIFLQTFVGCVFALVLVLVVLWTIVVPLQVRALKNTPFGRALMEMGDARVDPLIQVNGVTCDCACGCASMHRFPSPTPLPVAKQILKLDNWKEHSPDCFSCPACARDSHSTP